MQFLKMTNDLKSIRKFSLLLASRKKKAILFFRSSHVGRMDLRVLSDLFREVKADWLFHFSVFTCAPLLLSQL